MSHRLSAVSAEDFSQVDIIDAAGVLDHLPMSECIGMMAQAMIAVSEGASTRPARTIMPLVDGSAYLGIMPGSLSSPLVCGVKVVSLHPANASAGRPTIHGVVILFDHHTGRPSRATPEQITVYKSVGVVAQDLVAAHAIYLSYCRKLGRPIDGRE